MSSVRHKRAPMVFALFALTVCPPLYPAAAQQVDVTTSLGRFDELYKSGEYTAALAEAKRIREFVQTRYGVRHPAHAVALNAMAAAHIQQGNYGEAEALLNDALAIRQNALGETHPDVAQTLNNLAVVYKEQGNYGEAGRVLERAFGLREKVLGPNHPYLSLILNNLAVVYRLQGKFNEAVEFHKRALAIRERAFGASHPDVAESLINLANTYKDQNNYVEAGELEKRALAIIEQAFGADHPTVARVLNNLALGYAAQGKYTDAEGFYRRSLTIKEKSFGAGHPEVASTLNNLASLYGAQGKYVEAAGLTKRALAIQEKTLESGHPEMAFTLDNLASLYVAVGQYAEAEGLYLRVLAIRETSLGPNHHVVAETLNALAGVKEAQRKHGEAEELIKRALAIRERTLGANHPRVAESINNLALLYERQGKFIDAERLMKGALAIREKTLGANHPDVARNLINLALLSKARGDVAGALAWSRKATNAVVTHGLAETARSQEKDRHGGLVEERAGYFRHHVSNLAAAAQKGIDSAPALGGEAFDITQWAVQSSAALALQQMAARFAGGVAQVAVVRERQDLTLFRRDRDKALIEALSKPEGQQNQTLIDSIRVQIIETETNLVALAARLEKERPDYAALVNPKPLKSEEVQKLLGADEALVSFLAGEEESYVYAMTRDSFDWRVIPFGGDALEQKVKAFRRGLDVDMLEDQKELDRLGKKRELFDLAVANELYAALFDSIEPLVKNKKHLLVVPSGALTGLPFHLLVTERPVGAAPTRSNLAPYRDATWLMKRQAVTVLPSVASLKALRVFAGKEQAPKPLVGFGDPVFDPNVARANRPGVKTVGRSLITQPYANFWPGRDIDHKALAKAAPQLPDTADEVKAVARKLGAPMSDIYLGADASETTVKRTPLADYRIVYFATHGLIAGQVKGLGEPALLLSLPGAPSDFDDGILTASEIAQLKLNADWVVLSACNTAAGDRPGAEALSGLARAFFYAGARAILVSHWAVATDAATRLTTSTFDLLNANPNIGRAEALRRAMLDYMSNTSDPRNVYPAFWGSFEIVGEGAKR